jgi:transcription initiation factor TFIIIB Brf1 subunit/transcription initiation factor TFIIB
MGCQHIKRYDEKRGEVFCSKCGLVLTENCIDFNYNPEFESDRKVSRHFERPFLLFAGTSEGKGMITCCVSRHGRGRLKRLGILH